MKPNELTITDAQKFQPWTVPYASGVERARKSGDVPHILATHDVLHAMKSVGKLAAIFEAQDHATGPMSQDEMRIVKAMSADLVTAALRMANLYQFDLSTELVARVQEKNGVNILDTVLRKEDV